MQILIDKPANIDKRLLDELVNLVKDGGQVKKRSYIEQGIQRAMLIALLIEDDKLLSSATLKRPVRSYRDKVFGMAKANEFNKGELLELGYIVTDPNYEGQKLCQTLLTAFFQTIGKWQIFATTRKASMFHILNKAGFKKLGDTYKTDLELLFYNGKTVVQGETVRETP